RTQRLRFGALTQRVVENDDVGPGDILLPVGRLGNKAVGDVAFFFVVDVVADFVALFDDLPGDVTNQSREGDEQKFSLLHFFERPAPVGNGADILVGGAGGCVTVCLKSPVAAKASDQTARPGRIEIVPYRALTKAASSLPAARQPVGAAGDSDV